MGNEHIYSRRNSLGDIFNVEKPNGETGVSVANFDDSFFEKESPPVDSFSVSPAALGFGSDLETLTFKIVNHSGKPLPWNVAVDSDWLQVSPAGGTLVSVAETVTVTVNRSGLDLAGLRENPRPLG